MSAAATGAGERLVPPLRHPVARVLLAAFVVLHVALALAATGPAPLTLLALALVCGALTAIVLLPRLSTAAVAGCTAAILVGAAVTVLPLPVEGWPGYAAWALGGATFSALALTLRGRIRPAWLLLGALALECAVWSLLHGAGPLPGLNLIVRHAGTLLLGTLFAIGLRRAAASLDAFHRAARAQRVDRAVTATIGTEQQRVADRFLALAGDVLQRLASRPPRGEEQGDLLALEGRLRDEITAAALLTDGLNEAVAGARRRGVDVVLLSDHVEGVPPDDSARLAEWLTTQVEQAPPGPFVARVTASPGRLRASAHAKSADAVLELRPAARSAEAGLAGGA